MSLLRSLARLITTQVLLVVRDRQWLFWSGVFPIIILVVFGLASPDPSRFTLSLRVAGAEHNPGLMARLEEIKFLELVPLADGGEAAAVVASGQAQGALVIDEHGARLLLTRDLEDWKPLLSGLMAELAEGGDGSRYVEVVEGRRIRSLDFVAPGVIALTCMQTGLFGGTALLAMRAQGQLRRLRVTPVSPWALVLTHVVTRTLVALGQSLLLMLVAVVALRVPLTNPVALAGIAAVGTPVFAGLGLRPVHGPWSSRGAWPTRSRCGRCSGGCSPSSAGSTSSSTTPVCSGRDS